MKYPFKQNTIKRYLLRKFLKIAVMPVASAAIMLTLCWALYNRAAESGTWSK